MMLALGAVLFGTYVRVAGSNPEVWHIDPETAPSPNAAGHQITTADSPIWSQSPAEVMAAFQDVALASPRTVAIGGAASVAHMTFETRSQIWGFPDYTTVMAQPVEGGTALSVLGRLRYGASDLGVNEARIAQWMDALVATMPPAQDAAQ